MEWRSCNQCKDCLRFSFPLTIVLFKYLLFSPLWFGVGHFTDKRTVMNTCIKQWTVSRFSLKV